MTTFDVSLLGREAKRSTILVSFEWGDITDINGPDGEYYSTGESDQAFYGKLHAGRPNIEIELPELSGLFAEERATITLPIEEDSIFDLATDGLPWSKTVVRIDEILEAVDSGDSLGASRQRIGLFGGVLTRGIRNPNRQKGLATLEALSFKSMLSRARAGLLATADCTNVFGGYGCYRVVRADATDPLTGPGPMVITDAVLESIDSTSVVIRSTGSTNIENKNPTYWDHGYWRYRGLQFKIRSWDPGTNAFTFYDQPRASLIGRTGKLVPGCSKKLKKCRFWQNEQNFNGTGWAIPDHNPLFEVPE